MVQVIVEVTYECPGRCAFCPVRRLGLRGSMDVETFFRVLLLFRRVFGVDNTRAWGDQLAAVISGGEPSVLPNLWEYVRAARIAGYSVTVVTNAFHPVRVVMAEPDVVEVSVDYFGAKHDQSRGIQGLFDRAMTLLALAVKRGVTAVVRATAMRDNVFDIIMLREYLDACGLGEIPILVMPVRGAPELSPSEDQLTLLRRRGIILSDSCPAGVSSFVVTPKLEVLPCIFYRVPLGRLERLTEEELREIVERGAKLPRYPCEHNAEESRAARSSRLPVAP